jgi:predicted kinase
MGSPSLVVVSGPAGAGKTTLAHTLAAAIGCPCICRDEIKEGMVHAQGEDFQAASADPLTKQTLSVFFGTVRLLLGAGVTVVAEAAFQDHVWRPHLVVMSDLASIRIVRCHVDPILGRRRVGGRAQRSAHADSSVLRDADYYDQFVSVSFAVPTIDVDTSNAYAPTLDKIVAFAKGAWSSRAFRADAE